LPNPTAFLALLVDAAASLTPGALDQALEACHVVAAVTRAAYQSSGAVGRLSSSDLDVQGQEGLQAPEKLVGFMISIDAGASGSGVGVAKGPVPTTTPCPAAEFWGEVVTQGGLDALLHLLPVAAVGHLWRPVQEHRQPMPAILPCFSSCVCDCGYGRYP
jgi:hypothetical protein